MTYVSLVSLVDGTSEDRCPGLSGGPLRDRDRAGSRCLNSKQGKGFLRIASLEVCMRRNAGSLWAVVAALGMSACSNGGSMVPGISQQSLETMQRSRAGQFARIGHQPPVGMAMEWLLTDGSVLAQSGANWSNWYRYVPDAKGSYSDGTWTQVASVQSGYGPLYFAADVLADGRLSHLGGEYNSPGNGYDLQLTIRCGLRSDEEHLDPARPSKKVDYIGDSPSTVLPNGNMLVGDKLHNWDAYVNPKTLAWKTVGDAGKADFNAEEGWTLLPNGTILTADVQNAPNSEIYNPATGRWKTRGSTIVDLHSPSPYGCLIYGPSLCYYPPGEIGPSILRPDGTVFYTDPTRRAGRATRRSIARRRDWTAGPDFPNSDNAGDSYRRAGTEWKRAGFRRERNGLRVEWIESDPG